MDALFRYQNSRERLLDRLIMYAVVRTTGQPPRRPHLGSDALDLLLDLWVEPVPGVVHPVTDGTECDVHQERIDPEEHERDDEHEDEQWLDLAADEIGNNPRRKRQSQAGSGDAVELIGVHLCGVIGDLLQYPVAQPEEADQQSEQDGEPHWICTRPLFCRSVRQECDDDREEDS